MVESFRSPRVLVLLWLVVPLSLCVPAVRGQIEDGRGVTIASTEPGEGRVALVLGNAEYTSISPLQNTVHDAEDMSAALQRLGFDVIKRLDQSRANMYEAVRAFAKKAKGAEVALLFYAGHGVEVKGENYLVPVDVADLEGGDFRIDQEAVPLEEVLRALSRATNQVIVLDACRSNPFPDNVTGEGAGGGWAIPSGDMMGGTLVVYGTAPGAVASDNVEGRNGLFTKALLAELERPGIEAAEMMRRVTRRVREASNQAQSPWLSASYVLPFYFTDPEAGSEPDNPITAVSAGEVERWVRDGRSYYNRKDYASALPLLRKAARAGHMDSQYYLGTMYLAGRGVSEDPEKAADWFQLASMRGHAKAQYFLGGMYSGGFGGRRQDDARAADLYERAAKQGLAEGQFRLGLVYESGRGRPKDEANARRWYYQAAEQGYDKARAALERRHESGDDRARALLRRLP
ncbi:hypothetical protein BSZ35_18600 [Salinibacter sp. 10B]|uniref:caspase family protein n=1 Tax=Salinibacter sp. 10B TaxID=1923971 RepID=UPI000CF4CC37|nr:caspase family protein [Salinibacter sp. 10B]PQJ26935.1 hypothetical protein BSZ35_18600 [Salinibacter sp. 10B]